MHAINNVCKIIHSLHTLQSADQVRCSRQSAGSAYASLPGSNWLEFTEQMNWQWTRVDVALSGPCICLHAIAASIMVSELYMTAVTFHVCNCASVYIKPAYHQCPYRQYETSQPANTCIPVMTL